MSCIAPTTDTRRTCTHVQSTEVPGVSRACHFVALRARYAAYIAVYPAREAAT